MRHLTDVFDTFVGVIINKNNQMKKMRKAVYETAKRLAHPYNVFGLVAIKNEVSTLHPHLPWTLALVTEIMEDYCKKGDFTSVSINGFRTYSDPTYVFPTAKTALKVVKTKRGVPVAQTPIKRTRGGQLGVKRGPYKKTSIRAAVVAAGLPVGRPKKAITAAHIVAPKLPKSKVTVGQVLTAIRSIKTKLNNATHKATLQKLTKNHNVKAISKTAAVEKILQANPKYSNKVEFLKQDGTLRKMKFELLVDKPDQLGYLTVKDCNLEKTDPNNCIRNINCQTIKGLKVNAKRYTVK